VTARHFQHVPTVPAAGRRRSSAAAVVLIAALLASPLSVAEAQTARAQAGAAQEVGRFGDWIVVKHTTAEPRTCFAASQPVEAAPPVRQGAGGAGFFYVTTWPSAGVKLEPSVKAAAQFREAAAVTISVGRDTFTAFAADGSAYIADLTAELKLIDAMKKGSTMTVEGLSAGGVRQRAVYSLKGVTQALAALASAC
jgi:invasion protein IalB